MRGIRNARKSIELGEGALRAIDGERSRMGDGAALDDPVREVAATTTLPSDSPVDVAFSPRCLIDGCQRKKWILDPGMTVLFEGEQQPPGAEEFRSLRSRLYRVRKQHSLKSILIASALPREGRSFVAANLAQVLALQAGCRVLLIDADLRGPRLHSVFGTSCSPGFSEYLLNETDEFAILQQGSGDGLFLIPSGRSVQGQTELVANGRLQTFIDRVESLFDWIIIDSPAAIPVTDAGLIANSCDGVLLVVRSHSTPFDAVQRVRERFREGSLLGVVLNKIETKSPTRLSSRS
jgi:capsular exopolysaccharide synthesis family protein